jgi:hypothetical protein
MILAYIYNDIKMEETENCIYCQHIPRIGDEILFPKDKVVKVISVRWIATDPNRVNLLVK